MVNNPDKYNVAINTRPAVSQVASIDLPAEYITVVLETTEVVGITPKIIEFTTCELPYATNS